MLSRTFRGREKLFQAGERTGQKCGHAQEPGGLGEGRVAESLGGAVAQTLGSAATPPQLPGCMPQLCGAAAVCPWASCTASLYFSVPWRKRGEGSAPLIGFCEDYMNVYKHFGLNGIW